MTRTLFVRAIPISIPEALAETRRDKSGVDSTTFRPERVLHCRITRHAHGDEAPGSTVDSKSRLSAPKCRVSIHRRGVDTRENGGMCRSRAAEWHHTGSAHTSHIARRRLARGHVNVRFCGLRERSGRRFAGPVYWMLHASSDGTYFKRVKPKAAFIPFGPRSSLAL